MPQRYKLRLGDGTVLAVDTEGLSTWAHDRRAMAQAIGTQQWRPLQDVMAEEAAAARLAAALVRPGQRPAAAAPAPEPEPEPPAPPSFESPWEPSSLMENAPEPPGPAFELPEMPSPAPTAPSPFGASSFAPQEFEAPAVRPEPAERPAFDDEPVSQRYFEAAAEPAAEADGPVIAMKPLEEPEDRRDPSDFRSAWSDDGSTDDEYDADERAGGFDGASLTVLERVGGFLSRVLAPLAPAAERLTARRAKATFEPEDEREELDEPADEPEDLEPAGPSLLARLSAWAGNLRQSFKRPAADEEAPDAEQEDEDDDRLGGFEPAREPARSLPSLPRPHVSSKAAEAPKHVSELPAIPFKAPPPEPRRPVEQIYADDEPSRSWSFLEPAWQWLKLVVTTGALVAAFAYAWVERSRWLPRAADLGQSMFSELDRQVLERTRLEERQKALGDVGHKLPQLAPETIRIVFARNPLGVEQAPEVFQIAREAAERGAVTLPPAEQEELRGLESELVGGLSRIEQERVREYDRTRARRVIFPFENPHVMDLVAKGARLLPAERLARLQALLHQAVSAGLELPPAAPASPAPR